MEDCEGHCHSVRWVSHRSVKDPAWKQTDAEASVDLAEIEEPCRHEIQFGGMCANCGKDMTT